MILPKWYKEKVILLNSILESVKFAVVNLNAVTPETQKPSRKLTVTKQQPRGNFMQMQV